MQDMNAVRLVYGDDPRKMAKALLDSLEVAGQAAGGGDVVVKPNLVVSRPASGGATTHPEAVAGVIECLLDHGCRRVSVMESSWVGDDTAAAFRACGYLELRKRYGVELVDLKEDSFTTVPTPLGGVRVCDRILRAGFVVNVPVLKGHCQTRMTCAVKNLKGCIPDAEKRRFHRDGLDRSIAALALALRPGATVVDGVCGDLDFEEGGNPVYAGRMFAGIDPLRVDAFGCRLLGIDPREIGYLSLAAEYSSSADFPFLAEAPVELNRPGTAAFAPKPSGAARRLIRGVGVDGACSACQANLVHALKRIEERGARPSTGALRIGQGWRGKRSEGVGVGDCARGMADGFVPGCPPSAEAIVAALLGDAAGPAKGCLDRPPRKD